MKSRFQFVSKLPLAAIIVSFAGIIQSAQATSQTWDGAASDVWDTSAFNWAGAAFTSSNDALFTGTPTNNVATATGLTIGAITLDSTYTGSVTLTGANTVNGATTISGGTLLVGNATALGTSAITLSGGTLGASSGTVSMTNAISAATSTNSMIGGTGQGTLQLEVGSTLSGSGNIALASNFTIRGGNNTTFNGSGYTGTLTVNNGTTFLNQAGTGNKYSNINLSNAAVVVQTGGFVGYQHGGTNNGQYGFFIFGSLSGGGTLTSFGGGANNKSSTYQIGSSTLADSTFSGTITQGVPKVYLLKVGSNMLTLSGPGNNYTGDTTINGGTLALASTGSIPSNSAVILAAGAVFDTTAKTPFTLAATQPVTFGLNPAGAGSSGKIHAAALDISAAVVTFSPTGTLNDAVYILADYTSLTGTHFASATPPSGYTIKYDYNSGTQIALVPTGSYTYTTWADDNGATGQTKDLDHDNDGVDNGIEYFMGETGSTFTPNPALVGGSTGTVTWAMGANYSGAYGTDYEVQTSPDLVTWTPASVATGPNTVTVNPGPSPARSVVYTMPSSGTKLFVRLVVKN